MSWNEQTALERINRMMGTVPAGAIEVADFAPYYEGRERLNAEARRRGEMPSEPIWYVSRNRAVTTHGVHVYANLIDYNDRLVESGQETEASHERALQLLHMLYGAGDELIATFGINRVDYHGSRLHAVVLTPTGLENEVERIEKAIGFAAAFRRMADLVAGRYGEGYRTRVRIGIDSGPAVAINSGKRSEAEPLFVGSPANYAAKLAEGDVEGVFLSPRVVRARRSLPFVGTAVPERVSALDEEQVLLKSFTVGDSAFSATGRLERAFEALVNARDTLAKSTVAATEAIFRFHHRLPPLKTIDFADHPPSNTIRMTMASLFADIAGFTAYVDQSIQTGTVAQAVANLDVMRGEMAAVVRDDFGGRKVRFVGDCLHAILAEGDHRATEEQRTVKTAVFAAAGIRSSFNLCRMLLPGAGSLGIAIGIELGPTPVCRLGLRGVEQSVRCSSSRATCLSEHEQRLCSGEETALGENAYAKGGILIQHVFRSDRKVANLNFPNATSLLAAAPASPAYIPRREPEPMRAHFR